MTLREMALAGKTYAADGGYLRKPDGPEKLEKMVTVRVTAAERTQLEYASAKAGESLATHIRGILKASLTAKK